MILEKTLRWIVLIGVFALPFVCLIVVNSMFFPYITGKNFAFRIIVEIITGSWLALALVNPAYRPKRSWLFAALAIFVVLIGISDALGVVPFKSFWSNFERMDGWMTLAHLLAYTFVAASVLNTETLWRRLLQTSLGVSVYLTLYGFLQIAGITAIGQAGQTAGLAARIDATFGNPIYLAVYMLFHVFIAALLWAQSWNERRSGERLGISLAYGAIIIVDTIALLFTGTRGTTLGLVGGVALSALLIGLFSGSRRLRNYSIGTVAVIVVLAGGIYLAKDTAFVKSVGFLDRLASISTSDRTIGARFVNMSIAWQGVKERPLLGWGQENFAIAWDKYYDPRLYNDEPWFDRVHNIIFDWWIAGGTLGLLAYLSIFVTSLWILWRPSANMKESDFTLLERAIITGLLAGYFVHNLTVFDNITSYILFGTILGYLIFRSSQSARDLWSFRFTPAYLPYVTLVAAVLVWGVAWEVNAAALAQNRTLLTALQQQAGITDNLALFQKAISYSSLGTQEAREQLSQAATQVAQSSLSTDIKQQFFDTAVQAMKDQEAASPLDARFPLFLGTVYNAFGDNKDALAEFEKAHELSPKKQSIYFLLGQTAWVQGDTTGALQYFKAAYEEYTPDTDAEVYYAAAAIRAGQTQLVNQLLQSLMSVDKAADTKILAAFDAKGELGQAIPIWQAHIAASPDDIQGYFTLAALYYKVGQSAQAIAELRAAETRAPSVATQAESLIKEIQSGTATVQ
jgi:tetratricopeptide (TPR) repeat protein